MMPYGIIVKENRLTLQQSYVIWQKKFGMLRPGKFLKISFPVLLITVVLSMALQFVLQKQIDIVTLLTMLAVVSVFTALYLYVSAMRTVRQYAEGVKEKRVQLLLKENELEIMTEFSKEVIPYEEIDLCFEKDFLVTLIYDKNNFPLSLSKVNFEKGNYDVFVSLLKSRIPGRYEKKGEN